MTRGLFLGGLVVGGVATLLTIVVAWEDLPRPCLLCVPVLDIVAVALLHAEVVPGFPAVSVVAIFPLLWAAYAFGVPGFVVAIAGSVFILAYRFIVVGALPATLAEWINATTLRLVILGLAIVAFLAARVVHGEVAEGRARVSVSNEGPGMTHTEQRRVFDRFYRTARARSSAIQGYGLGLTTVRSIVRAHDGCIGIESVPEARTTITVDLPVPGPGDAGA